MKHQPQNKSTKSRIGDDIMAGMRELERMMDTRKRPGEMFTVRTVEVPDPRTYNAREVARLRSSRTSDSRRWGRRRRLAD